MRSFSSGALVHSYNPGIRSRYTTSLVVMGLVSTWFVYFAIIILKKPPDNLGVAVALILLTIGPGTFYWTLSRRPRAFELRRLPTGLFICLTGGSPKRLKSTRAETKTFLINMERYAKCRLQVESPKGMIDLHFHHPDEAYNFCQKLANSSLHKRQEKQKSRKRYDR